MALAGTTRDTTTRVALFAVWLVYAVSWLLPAVEDVSNPESRLMGWTCFALTMAPLIPGSDVPFSWEWGTSLSVASGLTNFIMLGSILLVVPRWRPPRRVVAAVAILCFVVDGHWFLDPDLRRETTHLSLGYYVWWLSFLALALALLPWPGRGARSAASGSPSIR